MDYLPIIVVVSSVFIIGFCYLAANAWVERYYRAVETQIESLTKAHRRTEHYVDQQTAALRSELDNEVRILRGRLDRIDEYIVRVISSPGPKGMADDDLSTDDIYGFLTGDDELFGTETPAEDGKGKDD